MPSSTLSVLSPACCKLLICRRQFRICRIRVPDLEQHLSALQTGREYYSFYKSLPDASKLLPLIYKLGARGDRLCVTITSKGSYNLWVWEPEAIPLLSDLTIPSPDRTPAFCKMLAPWDEYYPCNIYVPGIRDDRLALKLDRQFYSFFKLEKDFTAAMEVAGRLSRQGRETLLVSAQGVVEKVAQHLDESVVDAIQEGFVVCVLEETACLAALV